MTRISTLTICVALFVNQTSAQTAQAGRRPYQVRCAGCHGDDGTGGGHGPNIVDLRRPRATSKSEVRDLILKGIPGGGMPAFQIPYAIAVFVMALKTPAAGAAPGNPAAGERFFAGKGTCAACHLVRGVPSGPGGLLGPDLSAIGRDRSPAQIEQKLRDPEAAPVVAAGRGREGRGGPPPYRAVTVHLRNGQSIRGIAKNESAFDLQLLGMDGKLHLLSKDQVAEVVREKTLMPKVEATPDEMRNLVATSAGSPPIRMPKRPWLRGK